MLKHARSFATSSICRPMSQLPIGTSLSVSTAGPIYPLSWTRISSKKPRPSPGGTACPCASSSRRRLDGRLLGELRFVEIRASAGNAQARSPWRASLCFSWEARRPHKNHLARRIRRLPVLEAVGARSLHLADSNGRRDRDITGAARLYVGGDRLARAATHLAATARRLIVQR